MFFSDHPNIYDHLHNIKVIRMLFYYGFVYSMFTLKVPKIIVK